jgi:menaquinone-9 beta-reductase
VKYLQQAGIDPTGLGAQPIEKLRLSAKKRVVEMRLPFRALSLSRRVLDAALLQRAEEAGCDVRRGATVQCLARGEGSWSPAFAPEKRRDDGARVVDGWVAKLADGTEVGGRNIFLATGKHDLRGWTRPAGRHGDLVGFKMHWRLRTAQIEALRGFMDLFLFAGGYGGFSLVEDDLANLCLVFRRSRLRVAGGWEGLLAALRKENGMVEERLTNGEPAWERPLAISSIPYGYCCANDHGVWALGDQAAVIPSFTGDGMAIALHSGALAAHMFLAGKSPGEYQRALHAQLRGGMSIATWLSRAMVSRSGQHLASFIAPLLTNPIGWIAKATRIPQAALRPSLQHRL